MKIVTAKRYRNITKYLSSRIVTLAIMQPMFAQQ